MKLRMKMLVFIVVPVVILTAVSSFYSYYQSKAALEKQIMDTSNAQISYFSQELNRDLIVRESIVKNLAAIFYSIKIVAYWKILTYSVIWLL